MDRLEKIASEARAAFNKWWDDPNAFHGGSKRTAQFRFEAGYQAALDAIDEGWTDVPEGMVLVPREPTPEMCKASFERWKAGYCNPHEGIADSLVACYKAMLSAITPPQPEGDK